MGDNLLEKRQALIENFQRSMRTIRLLMGYSIIELAEYVGVTRQTINNLESGKSRMSVMQFLSIAAVVDNYIASNDIALNGDMYQAIEKVLGGNKQEEFVNTLGTSFSEHSLLKRWFSLFEKQKNEMQPRTECLLSGFLSNLLGGLLGPNNKILPHAGGVLDIDQMRKIVREYKIFLDDTVFFSDNTESFIKSLSECLIFENEKVIITLRAVEKIQKQTQNLTCSGQAVKALQLLRWMQEKNIIQIRGEKNDSNNHDTILSVFFKFRRTYRLCLITQDKIFADEVLRLNEPRSSEGIDIIIGHISKNGKLSIYTSREKEKNEAHEKPLHQEDNEEPALNGDNHENLALDGELVAMDKLDTKSNAAGGQADSDRNRLSGLATWAEL